MSAHNGTIPSDQDPKSRCSFWTGSYDAKDPAYVVEFPDIGDIITSGQTLGEAFSNACEALDLHLESLHKLGQRPPSAKHRLVVEAVK